MPPPNKHKHDVPDPKGIYPQKKAQSPKPAHEQLPPPVIPPAPAPFGGTGGVPQPAPAPMIPPAPGPYGPQPQT
jgi:hypothetical protein